MNIYTAEQLSNTARFNLCANATVGATEFDLLILQGSSLIPSDCNHDLSVLPYLTVLKTKVALLRTMNDWRFGARPLNVIACLCFASVSYTSTTSVLWTLVQLTTVFYKINSTKDRLTFTSTSLLTNMTIVLQWHIQTIAKIYHR